MQQIKGLREHAKRLREVAARSTGFPGIRLKLLALADQCDELAKSLNETLPASAGDKPSPPKSN
jgi:hypothetical protein